MEMRDEVLSSEGAQDKDTSGFQVSDLDDVEFHWENDQTVYVFRPGIDTPFSASIFNDFEMGWMADNPCLIDEGQHEENSPPPHLTTPISKTPTQPPLLMRSCPFGTKFRMFPNTFMKNLLE